MDQLIIFYQLFPKLWLSLLAMVGLIIGSFLNVLIYRMPIMLATRWHRDACMQLGIITDTQRSRYNMWWPRSACVHCGHPIAVRDNIPLLGWLLLRGRARCCQRSISWQYPLIEFLCALLFVFAGAMWPPGMALLGGTILLCGLLALSVIDVQTLLLPDELTLPLLWLGLLFNLGAIFVTPHDAIIGAVAGYVTLWLVYWLFKGLTGKDALGYGDFKLLAALGAWLGWRVLPAIVLTAALSGLVITLLSRGGKPAQMKQPIAFGPWLAIGGAVVLFLYEGPTSLLK
ncbi:peptidase A24 N- domain-containing protein [Campylobacter jejuni]|nr:peptidase A24 N- domain-containing protein [Campylobacter jejuni]